MLGIVNKRDEFEFGGGDSVVEIVKGTGGSRS